MDNLRQVGLVRTEMIPHLLRALSDPAGKVRWRAAAAMRDIGQADASVLHAIGGALADEQHWVEWHATETLKKLFPRNVVQEYLTKQAQLSDSPRLRAAAARKLAELECVGLAASNALSGALFSDSSSEVRAEAAKALGSVGIGSEKEFDGLIHALDDISSKVRRNAASSLTRLSRFSPERCARLVDRLKDNDREIKINAAIAVSRMSHESSSVLPILCEALTERPLDTYIWNAIVEIARADDSIAPNDLDNLPQHTLEFAVKESIAMGVLPTIGIKIWEPGAAVVFPSRIQPYPWKDIGVCHNCSGHRDLLSSAPESSVTQVCINSDWLPNIHFAYVTDLVLNSLNGQNTFRSPPTIENRQVVPIIQSGGHLLKLEGMRPLAGPFKTNRIDFVGMKEGRIAQYLIFAAMSSQSSPGKRTAQESVAAIQWDGFQKSFSLIMSRFGLESFSNNQWFDEDGWKSLRYGLRYERRFDAISFEFKRLMQFGGTEVGEHLKREMRVIVEPLLSEIELVLWREGIRNYPDSIGKVIRRKLRFNVNELQRTTEI